MNKITNELVTTLRAEINAALEAVAEKHGLEIHAGNATYTSTSVTFKVEVADVRANWDASIIGTGLLPDDLGKEGLFGKALLKIVGFDNNARTNKVQLTDANGKRYHATVRDTIEALNKANPGRAAEGGKPKSEEAKKLDAEAAARQFDTKAFICGLKGRVSFGQTFMYLGKEYKIVDLNTRAPKYPIVAETADGNQLRFTTDVLDDPVN